jgi:putative resolvase
MSRAVAAREAADYYGVSESNLRKWAREGKVETRKTPGGKYKYLIPDEGIHPKEDKGDWTENIIYCRVSSKKQVFDLKRQCKVLQEKYPDYTAVADIGSGINYKRKNFQAILDQLFAGKVKRVVVAHQDRFSRFGFDFFQWLFRKFGAVLESMEAANPIGNDELISDVMEVFTVFTARYYGSRKYKKLLAKSADSSDSESEDSDEEVL